MLLVAFYPAASYQVLDRTSKVARHVESANGSGIAVSNIERIGAIVGCNAVWHLQLALQYDTAPRLKS